MHRGRNYSDDLVDNVITLFDEGLTSTQVAKIINKRFRSEALGRFTRCSALSIKFRKGKCEKVIVIIITHLEDHMAILNH